MYDNDIKDERYSLTCIYNCLSEEINYFIDTGLEFFAFYHVYYGIYYKGD